MYTYRITLAHSCCAAVGCVGVHYIYIHRNTPKLFFTNFGTYIYTSKQTYTRVRTNTQDHSRPLRVCCRWVCQNAQRIHTQKYTETYAYMHMYIHSYEQPYVHTYMYRHICPLSPTLLFRRWICIYLCVHTFGANTHTRVQTYKHTCTNIHTHVQTYTHT